MNPPPRRAGLAYLLIGLWCSTLIVQAETRYWVGLSANNNSRRWFRPENWLDSLGNPGAPTHGDSLVFGTGLGNRVANEFGGTNLSLTSITLTNDGYQLGVNASGDKVTLGAAGLVQDGGLDLVTDRPLTNSSLRFFIDLDAAASIVNNSTNAALEFRQDNAYYGAGNYFQIDNRGFLLTVDGPGAVSFGAPGANWAGAAIQGTGGLTKNGTGALSLLATNTYTGPTTVNGGQLTITTRHAGGGDFTLADGTALFVTLTTPGTTLGMSSLTLGSASGPTTNGFNLGAFGNPTAPVVNASTLTLNGTVHVNIIGSGLSPGAITLIDYNTIAGSGTLVTNPLPAGVEGYLQTNGAATSIELVITAVPSLRWTGQTNAVPVGVWDINGTSNWLNLVDLQPAYFQNGLPVEFDDTGVAKTVTLSANVQPFSITVNNTLAYTFTNAGGELEQIAGTARLTKEGTGTLVLGLSNSYSGFTWLKQGTIQLAAAEGIGNGSTVTNDATYDLNGFSDTVGGLYGAGLVTNSAAAACVLGISGAGDFSGQVVDGQGTLAVVKNNGVLRLSCNNTYSGGTTISAGGTLTGRIIQLGADNVLGTGPVTWSGPCTVTPDSAAARSLANSLVMTADAGFGATGAGLLTCSGPVSISGASVGLTFNSDAEFSGPTFDVTGGSFERKLGPGTLRLKNISCTWNNSVALRLVGGAMILDGATVSLDSADVRVTGQIENEAATLSILSGSSLTIATASRDLQIGTDQTVATATNIVNVQGTLNVADNIRMGFGTGQRAELNLESGGLIVANAIVGDDPSTTVTEVNLDGGTLQANDPSVNFMTGLTNAFVRSGGVTVDAAFNITIAQDLLDGGGGGGLIKTGIATLQLDGANTYTGTTTVNEGGFGGDGTVAGPVVINSGATLLPGGGAIGTFTVNNDLTLNAGAAAVFELNTANVPATNDAVTVTGTLSITDSSLTVNNVGPMLVAGDSFQLFSQAVASGSFTTVVLPAGYVWNDKLAVDGSIEVVSLLLPPSFPPGAVTSLPDGNISLTATGAVGAIYSLWASPDVALAPVTATWTLLTNGTVTISPFTIDDLDATNYPQRFYLFSTP